MILGPKSEYLGLGQHEKTSQSPFLLVFFDFSSLCCSVFFLLACFAGGKAEDFQNPTPILHWDVHIEASTKIHKSMSRPFLPLLSNVHATPSRMTDKKELLDMQNQKACQRMTHDVVNMLRAALPLFPPRRELSRLHRWKQGAQCWTVSNSLK